MLFLYKLIDIQNKRLFYICILKIKYTSIFMAKQKVDINFIIDQSIILFRQKTYHNTSMADIAASCGILKGSLYHYFKSKEALMQKVIETIHIYFKEHVFLIANDTSLNSSEKINAFCNAAEKVFYNQKTDKLYGNMGVESAMVLEDFNPMLRSFFTDFFEALKTIFSSKYESKEAAELAERSVAEIEGSILLSRIFNDPSYLKNTFKRLEERI